MLGKFNGQWTEMATSEITHSDGWDKLLAYDTPYTLRVVAVECNIEVSLDGAAMISHYDCEYPEGTVGLKSYGAVAKFSNLQVSVVNPACASGGC